MTFDVVSSRKSETRSGQQLSPEQAAAVAMVADDKARGLALTGPDGLLKLFTKTVLETALNEEMTEHLGREKHRAQPDRESTNVRNGTRAKTVLSDAAGAVQTEVPRDREGTFEPKVVRKRQRRLSDVEVDHRRRQRAGELGQTGAVCADQHRAAVPVLVGQLGQRRIQDPDVVRGGIRPGVARARSSPAGNSAVLSQNTMIG